MDTQDPLWERKYPSFIINKCLAPTGKHDVLLLMR